MPPDDLARNARGALAHADTLFGSPAADTAAGRAAAALAEAAETLRTQQLRLADMKGAAADDYQRFAEERRAVLERLSAVDADLQRHLDDAVRSESSAKAASSAKVAAADTPCGETSAGRRAVITGLRAQIARQQELLRRQQEQAATLAEQVRALSYE